MSIVCMSVTLVMQEKSYLSSLYLFVTASVLWDPFSHHLGIFVAIILSMICILRAINLSY
jgi:hypothetical protein